MMEIPELWWKVSGGGRFEFLTKAELDIRNAMHAVIGGAATEDNAYVREFNGSMTPLRDWKVRKRRH